MSEQNYPDVFCYFVFPKMEYKYQVVCEFILGMVLNIFTFDNYAFIFMCHFINNMV